MTTFVKLGLVGVLAGTLGLVGCGSDSGGDNSGTGGTAGAPGTGGSAGDGGGTVCSDGPLPATGETGNGALKCVSTIPFDIIARFNATPTGELQAGENVFDLQLEIGVSADTVNSVIELASGLTVESSMGTINATAGDAAPEPQEVVDEGVPCDLTFERDMDALIVSTVSQGTFTLDDGETLELTLEDVTQEVVALGIPVTLTTEGDSATCQWDGPLPSVSFTLMQ